MRLDPHTGIAEFKEALRLQPGKADAHYNLPGLLAAQGDLDSTIAEYRLALVLKLNDRDSHNNLGLVLQQKGRGGASHQSVQGSLASRSHISGIALQPGQHPGPAEGLGVGPSPSTDWRSNAIQLLRRPTTIWDMCDSTAASLSVL